MSGHVELPEPCVAWKGHPSLYQARARAKYAATRDRFVLPWAWVTPNCDEPQCLEIDHLTLHTPLVIKYAKGVCIYCGDPAGGVDHLLPEPMTGRAMRAQVAVVPACADCNGRINDFPNPNVSERRRKAQLSIEKGVRLLLLGSDKSPEELDELGYALRTVAEKNMTRRVRVRDRLAWPGEDVFYDIRAWQKSGIPDPVSLGLCDPEAKPLRREYLEDAS